VIVKIVNASDKPQAPQLQLTGSKSRSKAEITVLKATPTDVNDFADPSKIVPLSNSVSVKGKTMKLDLAPYSLTVIRIK
jgi:alpha-L-arabinofuranosidase